MLLKKADSAFFLLFSITVYNYFPPDLQTTSKAFLEVIHSRVSWMWHKQKGMGEGAVKKKKEKSLIG